MGQETSTRSSEQSELWATINASRVRKAGLRGVYAEAKCDLGERVYKLATEGRGCFLFGPCGTGKTYAAAHAVRRFALAGRKAKLVTVSRLLWDARDGFDGGDRDVLARAELYDLLALDDFGAEKRTEWGMEQIEQLIDARYMRGLPTVITSNYSLGGIRDLWGGIEGQRIASRIAGCCERIEVGGEDRRLA